MPKRFVRSTLPLLVSSSATSVTTRLFLCTSSSSCFLLFLFFLCFLPTAAGVPSGSRLMLSTAAGVPWLMCIRLIVDCRLLKHAHKTTLRFDPTEITTSTTWFSTLQLCRLSPRSDKRTSQSKLTAAVHLAIQVYDAKVPSSHNYRKQ